jgi:hypothetical protein
MKLIVMLVVTFFIFSSSSLNQTASSQKLEVKECPDGRFVLSNQNCYVIGAAVSVYGKIRPGPVGGCLVNPEVIRPCGSEVFQITVFSDLPGFIKKITDTYQSDSVERNYGCIVNIKPTILNDRVTWTIRDLPVVLPNGLNLSGKLTDYCITDSSVGRYYYSFTVTLRKLLK